ncbi:hypothetical protein AG1IA_08140 [Rhizoctonia solani AG-1 IA]|uniref:Uncharacterized protein n=1 Tax=Thanatephorus cucumeris (strain AG1-IA) TaxID=983506 RepID=L8WM50_THACA|nr:hypothetical protein AG1IA_08140 [Rhizoctonia solani AG-1 IA]
MYWRACTMHHYGGFPSGRHLILICLHYASTTSFALSCRFASICAFSLLRPLEIFQIQKFRALNGHLTSTHKLRLCCGQLIGGSTRKLNENCSLTRADLALAYCLT